MNALGLIQLREQIDAIDDEIMELLLKRIELSSSIMKTKAPGQVIDSKREEEIILRYSKKLSGVSTSLKAKRLALALIAASSLYPES